MFSCFSSVLSFVNVASRAGCPPRLGRCVGKSLLACGDRQQLGRASPSLPGHLASPPSLPKATDFPRKKYSHLCLLRLNKIWGLSWLRQVYMSLYSPSSAVADTQDILKASMICDISELGQWWCPLERETVQNDERELFFWGVFQVKIWC